MKTGIVTMYYDSSNYGGNLQAYALCKYLNDSGFPAEQVCYSIARPKLFSAGFFRLSPIRQMKTVARKLLQEKKVLRYWATGRILEYGSVVRRDRNVRAFGRTNVPHSAHVWYPYDYQGMQEDYDVFIAGSDQVWNLQWGDHPAYFLKGIPKAKISYAASLGKSDLTDADRRKYRDCLSDYAAVSVREEDAVGLLKDISPVPVEWTLDPTLLLPREDWNAVCAKRMIPEKYMFCYFLGADLKMRKVAQAYARERGLKLVNMPFLLKSSLLDREYRAFECRFGEKRLYSVTPGQFLSLIRYADCVCTDSFHAMVFSGIYEREYFVFGRGQMNARIETLSRLYETEERFLNAPERQTLEYMRALSPIDYSKERKELARMQKKSGEFLFTHLREAKGKNNEL